jgi:diguanylate cyclase (GGDEF)-like protein
MRRLGLLARFAVLSLVLMALLGGVLAHALQSMIRERSLANAKQAAEVVSRLDIQSRLAPGDLRRPLAAERRRALDRVLAASGGATEIAAIKLWNRERRVVYADVPRIAGRRSLAGDAVSDELREALEGNVVAEILGGSPAEVEARDPGTGPLLRRYGQLLEVYVPIRFAGGGAPAGVFELYLPYRPIAAQIAHDSRTVYLVLLAGLAVLYVSLYRVVAAASGQLRRQVAENRHQALHDALTGLPNRALLRERTGQAIAAADRDLVPAALLLLDLNHFKEVNDTLGHHDGDQLLVQVGQRLRAALRAVDTVARLGGDEFAVLLPRIATAEGAAAVAATLQDALQAPFTAAGLRLEVEASIGAAVYPEHGSDPDELLQHADIAMYLAKQTHAGFVLFDAGYDQHSAERLALLGQLRHAMDSQQLVLYYQPKVRTDTGEVLGVEALVRWRHPLHGLLGPDRFIPLAERTGLIGPLTRYVLDAALRQCQQWQRGGHALSVAVNVSARRLLDLAFPDQVAALLYRWQVPPALLVVEITESTIMADPERAADILARLDAMGVQVSIDDFGTGYSSLASLRTLPVHELKIDRSFVSQVTHSTSDRVIVRSTVDLGRNLGLRVVAEGVEDQPTWQQLRELGCEAIQGYHISPPVPPEELTAWLGRRTPALDPPGRG